jgi:hypothetical protein
MDIEAKKAPQKCGAFIFAANSFRKTNLAVTPVE